MFYSKLRWKIKDLEDEATKLKLKGLERERLLSNWQQRCHIAEGNVRYLEEKNSKLRKEKEQLEGENRLMVKAFEDLRSERDELSCELVSAEDQHASAEKEIVRLLEENDHLRDLLRKKGCCPCDKRRKH